MVAKVIDLVQPSVDYQIPPSDMDAEAAILSVVMIDPNGYPAVADFLQPEHFYSEAHRRVFQACAELSKRGSPMDVVQVASWLKDNGRLAQVEGTPYLTSILNSAPNVTNVRTYGLRVHALWRLREAQAAARRVVAEGFGAGQDAQGFCEAAARAFHDLAYAPGTGGELEAVRLCLQDAVRELGNGKRLVGLPTGLAGLDGTLGGLHDGDLTILAARPGKGKSSLVLQVAVHVTRAGTPAAFFSLEMPKKQLALRATCSEAKVDIGRTRNGGMFDADWGRFTPASAIIGGLPLYIDDTAGITCMAMRARLRRFEVEMQRAKKPRPRLVVVDYLQLVHASPGAKGQNREREVAEVAQELKEIAKSHNVHVLACCQMNRGVEETNRRPRLRDLRESGAIEQAADNVVFIHEEPGASPGVVELIVEKQRNGPNAIIEVRFDRQYTRFDNLAEERDAPPPEKPHTIDCNCGRCP